MNSSTGRSSCANLIGQLRPFLFAPAELALSAVSPRAGVRRHTVVVWMLVASTVTASGAGAIIR